MSFVTLLTVSLHVGERYIELDRDQKKTLDQSWRVLGVARLASFGCVVFGFRFGEYSLRLPKTFFDSLKLHSQINGLCGWSADRLYRSGVEMLRVRYSAFSKDTSEIAPRILSVDPTINELAACILGQSAKSIRIEAITISRIPMYLPTARGNHETQSVWLQYANHFLKGQPEELVMLEHLPGHDEVKTEIIERQRVGVFENDIDPWPGAQVNPSVGEAGLREQLPVGSVHVHRTDI